MILLAYFAMGVTLPAPSQVPSTFKQLMSTRFTPDSGLPSSQFEKISIVNGVVYAISGDQTYFFQSGWHEAPKRNVTETQLKGLPPGAKITSQAKSFSGETWLTTTRGNFRGKDGNWANLDIPSNYKPAQPIPHQDGEIRQVVADNSGHIWVATDQGAIITDGDNWWQPLNRESGSPSEDILCLSFAPNGDVWAGTPTGAWRFRKGAFNWFSGKRWLTGNKVSSIVCADDSSAWLATDHGVSHIYEREMTLSQKADHYEEITRSRHVRNGYVTSAGLLSAGNLSKGILPEASDNDGLWTAIYIGAESFRYLATHDPKAKEYARQSMQALLDLTRLSGYPGFPARAIIRKGEKVSGYDANETVRIDGEMDKIWYTPKDHPDIYCKGDTSSDELDGHYFSFYVYFSYVADAAEKREIATVCRSITDNLLRNDYNLVGHTGRKTRWGQFGPKTINDDPRWWDQRGLNSLQMLTYLKVTHYVTGDEKYQNEYNKLISKHHYALNTLYIRRNQPWYLVNHSDDELSHLNFFSLFQLEKDAALRAIYSQVLDANYKAIRPERSPFYNFIYCASVGSRQSTDDSRTSLEEWPWDLLDWNMNNSRRLDVQIQVSPGGVRQELNRVLPVMERQIMRWNGNPYQMSGGDDGMTEEDGSGWLICYWMGRAFGYL